MALIDTIKAADAAAIRKGRRDAALVRLILLNAGLTQEMVLDSSRDLASATAMLEALAMLGDPDAAAGLRYFGLEVPAPLHPVAEPDPAQDDDGVLRTVSRSFAATAGEPFVRDDDGA